MTEVTQTISCPVKLNVLQDCEFQHFINKLKQSHHLTINLDENNETVSITGQKTSTIKALIEIVKKIGILSKTSNKCLPHRQQNPNNSCTDQMLTQTIELSAARSHFLEFVDEKYLNSIRNNPHINHVTFKNGQLQLSGQSDAIRHAKLNLEQSLYEKTISIPFDIKQHLTKTSYGHLLKEFSKKHHVGISLQPYQRPHQKSEKDKNAHYTSRRTPPGYRSLANSNTIDHCQQSYDDIKPRRAFRGSYRGRAQSNTVVHCQQSYDDIQPRRAFRGRYRGRAQSNTVVHRQQSYDDIYPHRAFRGSCRGRANSNTVVSHQQSYDDIQRRGSFRGSYRGRGGFRNDSRSQHSDDSQARGGFRRGSQRRIERGRGNLNITHILPNDNVDNLEEYESIEQYSTSYNPSETTVRSSIDDSDDDDDKSSQESDSDQSLSSTFTGNIIISNSSTILTEVTLCSDDILSLQEAIEELQNYSLYSESWALTADEYVFILKQKYQGKDQATNMSVKDRCSRIQYYLCGLVKTLCVHMLVFYKRGLWYVTMQGFKYDVSPATLQIKNHLRNIVKTEVQISISELVATFIKKKALFTINELKKIHNVSIELVFPSDHNAHESEQDDSKHCLKLFGSVSAVHIAQSAVQEFLNDLLETEHEIPHYNGNLSIGVRRNILNYIKTIEESEDYDAIAHVKFHRSPGGKRETRLQLSFTIVCTNEDTANDIVQQCRDMIEGYDEWTPTPNEYQALVNTFFVQNRPIIEQFQKKWNAQIYLDQQKQTVNISTQSKMVAQEIREALQNFASGRTNRTDRISVTIHIDFNIRRFVNQAIQSTIDEAKSKKIFIDTKNRNELTLSGRSEDVKPIEKTIQTIVNDIEQKIVINHLQLSIAQSELFRNNSYDIPRRIEQQTNTLIRDSKFTQTQPSSTENNLDLVSSNLKCVVNNRGQTIIVKKGDITKVTDVDAIINFDSHSATDNLLNKAIISVNAPEYVGNRREDRSSLFFSISSALQNAQKENYTSVALPSIYTQLQDCAKTTVIAIKQFFADYPTSHLIKIILIDMNDSFCHASAAELVNDHTNDIIDHQLPSVTAKWCWQDNVKEIPFNDNDTRQIEAEFQRYVRTFIQTDLEICINQSRESNSVYYLIQFYDWLEEDLAYNPNALNQRLECGYQANKKTSFIRPIIRYPPKQEKQSKSDDRKHLDIYQTQLETTADDWQIIGITNSSTKQAQLEMKKVIQNATITERFAVNLLQNINTHEKAIKDISIQNLVQVDFENDRTHTLTIVLNGVRQNVSQAKLDILSYTNDIISTTMGKDDELSIPKQWIEQEEECKLVQLAKDDPEFTRIERRINETMSGVKILTIERIQNVRLWNQYVFQRRTLQQTLTHKSNSDIEMELFHGTRGTPPDEIYNGDCGFDVRFCTSGLWGIGSYFAKNALYSCQNYSYKLSDGKRQVFLAYVLVGDACDYGTRNDSSLRMPPKKDAKASNVRYNSVTGETRSSRVYIVYDNRLTYPAFLITFTP